DCELVPTARVERDLGPERFGGFFQFESAVDGGVRMATGAVRRNRRPEWNLVSFCVPLLGFVVGCLIGVILRDTGSGRSEALKDGVRVWFAFCTAGVVVAIFAFVRAERLWGVTALGFLLNFFLIVLTGVWLLSTDE